MSAAKASTAGLPGVARMRAAAASVRAGSRPVMPTRAPSAASPIAVAMPMPPVPPVTRTDFPAMRGASAMVQSYPGGRPNASRRTRGPRRGPAAHRLPQPPSRLLI